MGFFDDFGKKVTDASQKAMQKTQEMSEMARLNSLISQNENKIKNAYGQIGQLFVELCRDDYRPEFAELMTTVIGLEQENDTYRKQLQDMKGVQRCEQCGAEIPKGAAFCNSCGAPVAQTDKQEAADEAADDEATGE